MKELPNFVASELNLIKTPVSRIARLLCAPSWDEDQTTAFGTKILDEVGCRYRIIDMCRLHAVRVRIVDFG